MNMTLRGFNKFSAIIILLTPLMGCQWVAEKYLLPHEGIRPGSYKVDIQWHSVMNTSDGVELAADIFFTPWRFESADYSGQNTLRWLNGYLNRQSG